LQKTEENAMQGINPGGYYYAIWCRDASYILRDWFLSGHVSEVLRHLYLIWSHQLYNDGNGGDGGGGRNAPIWEEKEKVVYGRGSPETKFRTATLPDSLRNSFDGALPTTIYQAGYCEIYGKEPDIDSTALMVSTTSWVLSHVLDECSQEGEQARYHYHPSSSHDMGDQVSRRSGSPSVRMRVASHRFASLDSFENRRLLQDPVALAVHLSKRMTRAVRYLAGRDVDGDGVLEQGANEDWMDTALRSGKIVYSQAAWIMSLNNFAMLLSRLQQQGVEKKAGAETMDAEEAANLANRAVQAAEKVLWSEEEGSYVDIHSGFHIGKRYRLLTQDVSLYLVAITENTGYDSLRASGVTKKVDGAQRAAAAREHDNGRGKVTIAGPSTQNKLRERSLSTLAEMKKRIWKEKWPLITEAILDTTGPWVLKPFEYHNHTFWPWITGIEMLARSRFNMMRDCNTLLSTLASDGHPHTHAFYEWVNPLNDRGGGAYPFRTGIAEVRIVLTEILAKRPEISGQDDNNDG
jgi:hypothetical protein